MSLTIHFLHSHFAFTLRNMGAVREKETGTETPYLALALTQNLN